MNDVSPAAIQQILCLSNNVALLDAERQVQETMYISQIIIKQDNSILINDLVTVLKFDPVGMILTACYSFRSNDKEEIPRIYQAVCGPLSGLPKLPDGLCCLGAKVVCNDTNQEVFLTFKGLPIEVHPEDSDQVLPSVVSNGSSAIESIDDETESMTTDTDIDSDPMLSSPGEVVTVGEGEPTDNPLARSQEAMLVRRFQRVKNGASWNYGEKEKHRILFKVKTKQETKVHLHGISLYVEEMMDEVIISVSAMTDHGSFGVLGHKKFFNVSPNNQNSHFKTAKLFFEKPVKLLVGPKSDNFLITATLSGGSSAIGTGHAKAVRLTSKDESSETRKATVIFRTYSAKKENLTTEEEGQIPSIIISL
jgi:hypothetical protein